MRWLVLLLPMLLFAGCVSEVDVSPDKDERVLSTHFMDIDEDGVDDVQVYTFSPVEVDGGVTLQRRVFVSAENSIQYGFYSSLTDVEVLELNNNLETFVDSAESAFTECSNELGLIGVSCGNVLTCTNLCSASSLKCKDIGEAYPEALGTFILNYVRDENEISKSMNDVQRQLPRIKQLSEENKLEFADDMAGIINGMAKVCSNPLMTSSDFDMCNCDEYQKDELKTILEKIGDYKVTPERYRYIVTITGSTTNGGEDISYNELSLQEKLSRSLGISESMISFPDSVDAETTSTNVILHWGWVKSAADPNGMMIYEVETTTPPDKFIAALDTPEVTSRKINLFFLSPISSLYDFMGGLTGNYRFALGSAAAIPVILILILYFLLRIAYNSFKASSAGEENAFEAGLRRSVTKAGVRWKTDLALAALLFVIGLGTSAFFAEKLKTAPDLFGMIDIMFTEPADFVSIIGVFFGFILLYSSALNRVKISLLERFYGMEIKREKDLFIARIDELKEKLKVLRSLVEELTAKNFDIGTEYDVLAGISVKRIDQLAKKNDPHSRKIIEDELIRVEEAIDSVNEKKRVAEEKWDVWSNEIDKMINDTGEAYSINLVGIPSSLRVWAMSRYLAEHRKEGLVFERDALRKKKIPPELSANALIVNGLLKGFFVIKGGKVTLSGTAKGAPSILKVLALKMHNYFKSMIKKLNYKDYTSVVAEGGDTVILVMKQRTADSVLIIERSKFNQALEGWKERMGNL